MHVASGPFTERWQFPCDGSVISVAATAACSLISVATVARSGYLLSGSGELIWKCSPAFDFEAWSTAISADGTTIAFGTANKNPTNGTIYVFDRAGVPVWSTRIGSPVWSLSLSDDGLVLAASCWNNRLLIFQRDRGGYRRAAAIAVPDKSGLYGVKLASNGQIGFVCSYDSGVYVFDQRGNVVANHSFTGGLYNISLFNSGESFVAGCAEGRFLRGSADDPDSLVHSQRVAQRPVCGVSATSDGELVACGSFNGHALLATGKGDLLWSLETQGEVWSTAISRDGSSICVGSGDHTVRLLHNRITSAAIREIQAAETVLLDLGHAVSLAPLENLRSLYARYGLVEYGVRRLSIVAAETSNSHVLRQQIEGLLLADIKENLTHFQSHYDLGCMFIEAQRYDDAVRHLQDAARSPTLRSAALRRAAECFSQLRLSTAMRSTFRQAREQYLDNTSKQLLYNMAQSYEHAGDWREAKNIYEMLVSWDISFRNAWDRLEVLRQISPGSLPDSQSVKKDYTGLTTSLLGPDAPKDVDQSLRNVLLSRAREIAIALDGQQSLRKVVEDLLTDETFSIGIRRDLSRVNYDFHLFLKYEYGLPEDEMKKFLETVNAMPYIKRQMEKDSPRSLDVGSATGRYPFLLSRLGFHATGIDLAEDAVRFSTNKAKEAGAEWPKFICGDVREIDVVFSHDDHFNLITCMMGTFDHVPASEQDLVLRKLHNLLSLDGVAIISVWDIECRHLAYLSMYDEHQKEMIRKNSPTRDQLRDMMVRNGFSNVTIVPFCLLPQVIVHDLALERMSEQDILMAAMADAAAKGLLRDQRGEMYLAIGYR